MGIATLLRNRTLNTFGAGYVLFLKGLFVAPRRKLPITNSHLLPFDDRTANIKVKGRMYYLSSRRISW